MFRRSCWLLAILVQAMALGCGGGGHETVAGKVTLDGAPLAKARVALTPQSSGGDPLNNLPFVGETDDDGQYSLGAVSDGTGGVPPGKYRLSITTAFTTDTSDNAVTPPERVPPPHRDGVDFEVADGGNSAANFDLKSE